MGEEPRFSPARRMAQMIWNDDLAFLAHLNTRQCRMSHDACRNTNDFRFSGQNLGSMGTTAAHHDPTNVIDSTITRWYNEHPYATQDDIDILRRISDDEK